MRVATAAARGCDAAWRGERNDSHALAGLSPECMVINYIIVKGLAFKFTPL